MSIPTIIKVPFKFIDLFAGIGGFHQALTSAGLECVFASEMDKFARNTYALNHAESSPLIFSNNMFAGDITSVIPGDIPDFDVLCAGFPCQPFSQAGHQKGFEDTRGTLFYNIAEILKVKRPQAFILENVRNLESHNDGKTFSTIKEVIQGLGYSFTHKLVKGTDFGVPQPRPRVYMVGFLDPNILFKFPDSIPLTMSMSDILGGHCPRKIGFTLRVGGRHSPISDRHNWDGYIVDGVETRLTIAQALALQGFPPTFKFEVSETQAMKQLGNSIVVPVATAIATAVLDQLKNSNHHV